MLIFWIKYHYCCRILQNIELLILHILSWENITVKSRFGYCILVMRDLVGNIPGNCIHKGWKKEDWAENEASTQLKITYYVPEDKFIYFMKIFYIFVKIS